MNRKEKMALTGYIAEREWPGDGLSSSEASLSGKVSRELKELFNITDDELAFDRAFSVGRIYSEKTGSELSEDVFDQLIDYIVQDYTDFIDQIESRKWEDLVDVVLDYWDKQS
ncbi:hypothetical protein EVB81_246 [Rhizobium phage RHph_I46]|uniref:Uncharacterized protein n=1 Tax=Rhizobium phage RHph_I1_9 TaxID=2509729 RepID=A0A7S5RDV3_9CAUD|nr:hypothetical protein PP936_gp244 [Rhizobium phage RHph_I1_9]QIG69815.1 hypothetical protein EVB81_246 [Rhizobium phage RHph_I46]QIG71096.1 hypothetical protein EVB92_246 [Rhizobium phage RHph_I9]QIG73681.1 hypothetical protein EVC04_244 [Rhizobium phage RHph_I1_9]QIG76435.1 hypothetical protein EVC25_246 [Rhizobium phage RHph_I34]